MMEIQPVSETPVFCTMQITVLKDFSIFTHPRSYTYILICSAVPSTLTNSSFNNESFLIWYYFLKYMLKRSLFYGHYYCCNILETELNILAE
jgi:hypothetical protein